MRASMNSDMDLRIVSADEAVKRVQSGQRVYIHNGCAEPTELVQALTRRGPNCKTWKCCTWPPWGWPITACRSTRGTSAPTRCSSAATCARAIQEGRGDYTPVFLSEIEGLFTSGAMPVDVALLQCTPPDAHGYHEPGAGDRRVADGGGKCAPR